MLDCQEHTPDVLFRCYREGADPDVFRLVVEQTTPKLAHCAQWLGLSASDVEDVLQETYLAVLLGAPRFDASRRFAQWVLGILAKKATDVHRQTVRRRIFPERLRTYLPRDPSDDMEADELRRDLDVALLGLPERYRDILGLRFEQGMNAEQIGRTLGLPASTVRTRISRGLDRLRCALRASHRC